MAKRHGGTVNTFRYWQTWQWVLIISTWHLALGFVAHLRAQVSAYATTTPWVSAPDRSVLIDVARWWRHTPGLPVDIAANGLLTVLINACLWPTIVGAVLLRLATPERSRVSLIAQWGATLGRSWLQTLLSLLIRAVLLGLAAVVAVVTQPDHAGWWLGLVAVGFAWLWATVALDVSRTLATVHGETRVVATAVAGFQRCPWWAVGIAIALAATQTLLALSIPALATWQHLWLARAVVVVATLFGVARLALIVRYTRSEVTITAEKPSVV